MASLLKDLYSVKFFTFFSEVVREVVPHFEPQKFKKLIFDNTWHNKELKQRMRHTALVLHNFLPEDFPKAAKFIEKIIMNLKRNNARENSLEYMFLSDYIEVFGINDFGSSVKLIEFVTQFTSCEFAVRPFIIKYSEKMIKQMQQWSLHESHHVRRLASEGSRPRLPWAIALPELKKDPRPILPLLENLKEDPSEYVRRSVANSLNDISKDNPTIAISIAGKWKGLGKDTDAIIKHGCRTLLKLGHPDILEYYGLTKTKIELTRFKMLTPEVKVGTNLQFSFTLLNDNANSNRVRLEYGVFYLRQNGRYSKKVFKISERLFQTGEKITIQKKQSFKIITTRKFYPGKHKLSLIINGLERKIVNFKLVK